MKKLYLLPAPLVGAAAYLTRELYRYTFNRKSSRLMAHYLDKRTHEEEYYSVRDAAAERVRQTRGELMEIRSARGQRLRGWYYPLGGEGKRIAFIIHGYHSEHAETTGLYLDYYASRGFDLFACDHAAHGQSEGQLIGFDYYECEDCLLWLDALRQRFGDEVKIILHGFSMGAATVMKMSSRCPEQVRFIVADCGYASGEELLRGSLGKLYPLMRALNRVVAGYDLRDTDVRPSLAASDKPILFVHGRQDPTVPFANSEELFASYQGPKDCFFVDDAWHVECMYVDPEGYAKKLDEMIEKYF